MPTLSVEVELKVYCGTCSAGLPFSAALHAPDATIPGAIRVKPCPLCVAFERGEARCEGYRNGRKDENSQTKHKPPKPFRCNCCGKEETAAVQHILAYTRGTAGLEGILCPECYDASLTKPPEPPRQCTGCGRQENPCAPLTTCAQSGCLLCGKCHKVWCDGHVYGMSTERQLAKMREKETPDA